MATSKPAKDEPIVVLGAGPAGVHFASLLKKKGYTNVTILEASDRVGGKSLTLQVDDVPHEMGTCYLHPGYDPVRELVQEYAPGNVEVQVGGEADGPNRKIFGLDGSATPGGDFLHGQDFTAWVFAESEKVTLPRLCWPFSWNAAQGLVIFRKVGDYIRLHRQMFGEYEYGLPPEPSAEVLKDLDCTFLQWLEKKGFKSLVPMFVYAHQIQGYGRLNSIPALYGVWWNDPAMLEKIFHIPSLIRQEPSITMLTCGFNSIWTSIVEKDDLNVHLNNRVVGIERREDRVTVVAESGRFEAKLVVITTPLKFAMEKLISNPTELEKELLSPLQAFTLATTLYEADPVTHEHPVEFWLGPINQANGHLYAHRNSALSLFGESEAKPRRVAYQFENAAPGPDAEQRLNEVLLKDLEEVGETNVKILETFPWEYFWHYPQEAIQARVPWRLLGMQGQNRTIYAGASACFESVIDVMSYNFKVCAQLDL